MRRRDLVILVLGGAVFSSRESRTQERRIGLLGAASPDAYAPFVAAFRSALNEAGYVEGRNLEIEFRWAEGHYDRLPELAADLVRSRVEVIVTSGGDIVIGAAKAATAVPDHLHQRRRSRREGICREPRPAGRQHDRRFAPRDRVGSEAAGAYARAGPQYGSDCRADQSEEFKCRTQFDGNAGGGARERRAAAHPGGEQRQ